MTVPLRVKGDRKAEEEEGLDTLLTSHIRKGKWRVVLEYLDGLPRFENPFSSVAGAQDDEGIGLPLCYSSQSGILTWWLLYPPNAYTMPWIRTDKIYTLIDHVLLLLLPTSYLST